jgi:hypothetical protein
LCYGGSASLVNAGGLTASEQNTDSDPLAPSVPLHARHLSLSTLCDEDVLALSFKSLERLDCLPMYAQYLGCGEPTRVLGVPVCFVYGSSEVGSVAFSIHIGVGMDPERTPL